MLLLQDSSNLWEGQEAVTRSVDNSEVICKLYGDSLQTKALSLFDNWYADSELAADNIGSFLQDLIFPSGGQVSTGWGLGEGISFDARRSIQ